MEEIINSPEYQQLLPYLPYLLAAGVLRLIIMVYLCMQGRKALLQISKENRNLGPDQVWLLLVPFLNIYWNFVFVRRFTESLNNEFYDRKVAVEENPTQRNGYLFAGSFLVYNFPLPMFVGFVAFVISIVTLILYLAKVNEHKKLLEESNSDRNPFLDQD